MTTRYRKFAKFCAVSAIALAVPQVAYAAEPRSIDIAAQPLSSAIVQLSEQSDTTILVSDDIVRGLAARSIKGSMTPERALRELLRGTGLKVSKGAGGALVISGNASGGDQAAIDQKSQQGLVGAVVDQHTGAALKGAFVELVETGQNTATDELGRYRFSGVEGVKRVRISYLGYPALERDVEFIAGRPSSTIILEYATSRDEIVVVAGQASARAQALNQERTAGNSVTVISSDLLGNFQGTTISEALRKAPGVSFQQNDATGDGDNVIVRGLAPDYNQVKLNGVVLPVANGYGRAANLGGLLADSVSEIRINKTLLPSQDGAGTGGLIEIETKSPLDRPRRYFGATVEGAKRGEGYSDDFLATGIVSARFGASNNFGIKVAAQYRERTLKSYNYETSLRPGPYLPVGSNARPLTLGEIDPRTAFPFAEGNRLYPNQVTVGSLENHTETLGVDASIEWQISDSTNFRLDYNRTDQTVDTLNVNLAVLGTASYQLLPVASLGGAQRYVLRDPLTFGVRSTLQAGLNEGQRSITDTLSFRGETKLDRWEIDYRANYANGRSRIPSISTIRFSIPSLPFSDPNLFIPEAIDSASGYRTTIFGPRSGTALPLPLFSEAGFDLYNSPSATRFDNLTSLVNTAGQNWTASGGADVKYEVGGLLEYIKVGGEYSKAHFDNRREDNVTYNGVRDENFNLPLATALGIEFENVGFTGTNNPNGSLRVPTSASIRQIVRSADQTVEDGFTSLFTSEFGPLNGLTFTEERTIAGYLEGKLNFDDLEVIGGVRFVRVNVDAAIANAAYYINDQGEDDPALTTRTTRILNVGAHNTDWLPRVIINYRPTKNFVLRAGYFSTVARPQVELLSAAQTVSYVGFPVFGPNGDQPQLVVDRGNPGLKPAVTHNFDIGGEYYFGSIGVAKANFFYKRVTNLLESTRTRLTSLDGVELPDDPRFQDLPSNLFITANRPINNPDPATVWGGEFSFERRFDFLPGALSGLGVYANYTFTKSRKNEPRTWFSKPVYDSLGNITTYVQEDYTLRNVPFLQSPKHSGTASLTYSRPDFDAALTYSYQARRLQSVADYSLSTFEEALSTLDFRAEYRFALGGGNARLYLEGTDLLKSPSDPDTQRSVGGNNGVPKAYTSGYFRGGRTVTAGIGISF